MDDKTFDSIDKQEILKGFKIILSNANNHFNCAKILADKKLFGLAISHLILASEEAIKAIYFARKKMFPDERLDITGLFSNHFSKHSTAVDIMDLVKDFYYNSVSLIADHISKNPDVSDKDKSIVESEHKLFVEQYNKFNLEYLIKWWEKANRLKNKGFYADYYRNKWSSPEDLKEQDYLESYPITGVFLAFVNILNDYNFINGS